MSVVATIASTFTLTETIDVNNPFGDAIAANKKNVINGLNRSVTLNGASTPPATLDTAFQKALVAGAATIDLTALVGRDNLAIDGTGLKVRAAFFENPAANANPITITFGAANGYLLLGAAWKLILAPGQWAGPFYLKDGAPAIDATHKNIDLAGTGTQALNVGLVIG